MNSPCDTAPEPAHDDAQAHGGGRRARLFRPGDLKLLALHILAARPCHGYEVIRSIGELVGGGYAPSPGTIYPTLAFLEDRGVAAVEAQADGRKLYRITAAGERRLAEKRPDLDALLARLRDGRSEARARQVPDIMRAMENLKTALRLRFAAGRPDDASVRRIADIIDRAAVEVSRLPDEPR